MIGLLIFFLAIVFALYLLFKEGKANKLYLERYTRLLRQKEIDKTKKREEKKYVFIDKGNKPSKEQITKGGDIGIVPKEGRMYLAEEDNDGEQIGAEDEEEESEMLFW